MSLVVFKRNKTEEAFNPEKIHKPLKWATKGVDGVSISEIEMRLSAVLRDRKFITSEDLHEELIKATKDCISEESPNYDIVAGKLVNYQVRKEAYGTYTPPHLLQIVKTGIAAGRYDPDILGYYSDEEWDYLNSIIDHDRDNLFRYAGAEQMRGKYLVKNRITDRIFESFQIPYILAGAVAFHSYPKETRLFWVKEFYDLSSQHYISLPTPIMGGVRTRVRQYSSCVVMDTGDDLDGIANAASAAMKYVALRAGLGINVGNIRGLGADINDGEVKHTGIIPFIKALAGIVKCCSKGGIRDGAVTFYIPAWHMELPEVVVLRDNSLTEENTCFAADYAIQFNRYLYQRFLDKKNITLFAPGENETPGLYEAFFDPDQSKFAELYEKYEADPTIRKRTFSAEEILSNKVITQRSGTGRIYISHVDLMNKHTPFKVRIKMSNLCVEIALPTGYLKHIDSGLEDGAEISLCTLAAQNWGKVNKPQDFERSANVLVRFLDALLDYQEYPLRAAEESTKSRRPLGIGLIGFAHFLAKRGMYYHQASMSLVDEYAEAWSYYLIKASVDLAKEKGPCALAHETKWVDGWTPNMTRPEYLDEVLPHVERMDWKSLREDLKKYGIRNSTLMAGMPSETSSQLSNETNGFEPPREPISRKGTNGELPIVVPDYLELKDAYDWAWEQGDPVGYLYTLAPLQKHIDQAMSINSTYKPRKLPKGTLTTSKLIKDLLLGWKLGHKNFYYQNTYKEGQKEIENMVEDACSSGACKI